LLLLLLLLLLLGEAARDAELAPLPLLNRLAAPSPDAAAA
jgi:hypothetical protein